MRPPVAASAPAARSVARIERPILPFETLRLEGETDARSWTFHLTQDEAASGTTLSIGYKNAVVVMPEGSRLRIAINGESVLDTPIASSNDIKRVTSSIRPGLLRPGQNIIRMESLQRHRTDCTVAATYELWTDVDSASTRLIFAEGATKTLRGLDDLPAVGVDSTGVTTIRVVAPKIYRPEIRDRLLRLAQTVALRGRYAHPVIQVMESDPGPSPVGTIKVAMGLAGELRGLVPGIPDAASVQPLTMMMQEPGSTGSTLVVAGPTWQDLDTAIGIVRAQPLNPLSAERGMIDTASWHWPEVPTAFGGQSFRFADLGVPTQEFRTTPESRVRHQSPVGLLCHRVRGSHPAPRCSLYVGGPARQPCERVRQRPDQHADDDHHPGRHRPAAYRPGPAQELQVGSQPHHLRGGPDDGRRRALRTGGDSV
ncbi:cellulose biosynthesis cyclic di-GMP-binding regulatory protein BcsB [Microvirga arabica]|nr:cellulose biosynthesis cyclic di-GMP-binding regulatory protein BcsB [Microvirga arabica]